MKQSSPEPVRQVWLLLVYLASICNRLIPSSTYAIAIWREVLERIKAAITPEVIAIGEVGLDYYWSREFEKEQLEAFEEQVRWAVELQLPLMIHCRKAQNEMVAIIKEYQKDLPGGVFHCFTGNEPAVVPLDRIVLETDSPYMAPVPKRGERNEPAYVAYVLKRLAEAYGVSEEELAQKTNDNCKKVLNISA